MFRSPRAFNAALYAFQFVVRYLRRPQFVSLISPAYRSHDRYLCNNALQLNDDLSVLASENRQSENAAPKMLRYARQLAMVFRNESVVTIYRMLGLKSL